ncbi:MAG: hypothetical protein C5B50_26895 [Verrucomicrobia bacterium]|nr:MAG: hypothetical protein C5B50_26895 [Verrucomicrobiota bacterium]
MPLKIIIKPASLDSRAFRSARSLSFACCLWLLAFCSAAPLLAAEPYLAPGHPDPVALLAPPPAPGSTEEIADLQEARAVFKARTAAEKERAVKDSGLSFSLFKAAIGPVFVQTNLPRTAALLEQVKKEIGVIIDTPKDHWKRKRPYELDPELSLGKPEPSFGYPSGHSTRGTVYSMVLAELFPSSREAILQVGRNIGWDRVLIGKHFPTDVQAGRVLGQAIVHELMSSPSFLRDLSQAKAEISRAGSAQLVQPPQSVSTGKLPTLYRTPERIAK